MIRIQAYYFLALLLGSALLFHSATAASTSRQRSSNRNGGSSDTSDEDDQSFGSHDVTAQQQRQSGGRNRGLLHKDNVYQSSGDSPKDNVYQREKTLNNCKDGKDKCSAIDSILQSYLEAVEKNVQAFEKVNKNIAELLKIVSNSKSLCDEGNSTDGNEGKSEGEVEGECEDEDETESTTPKLLPSRKPVPMSSTEAPKPSKVPTTSSTTLSTSTRPSVSTPTESRPVYKTFRGNENEQAKLKCDKTKDETIVIVDAYYGVADVSECPPTPYGPVTGETGNRKDLIRSLCGTWTQSQCSFPITSSSLGESCKGVEKFLRVNYYCSKSGIRGIRGN